MCLHKFNFNNNTARILLLIIPAVMGLYAQPIQDIAVNHNRERTETELRIILLGLSMDRHHDFMLAGISALPDTHYPMSNMNYLLKLSLPEPSDFLQPLRDQYEKSKPTTFQKVLGAVNFGAAAALAGAHIYKYHLKKKKK